MKVLLLPADDYGCGYYRMRLPARWSGAETRFEIRIPVKTRDSDGRVLHVDVGDADVVVFQRPMMMKTTLMIQQLQAQGVAVVVEVDDDLTALDDSHAFYRHIHPRHSVEANWMHLKDALLRADLVTCTTPALAKRFAGHGRYAIIPNYIQESLLRHKRTEEIDIGWGGSVGTHPRDLPEVGTAIRDLVAEGFEFAIVGEGRGATRQLCLEEVNETGWLDMTEYWAALANLRTAIVPLRDTAFNRAKSWLKGLELAALGVPFVASPTPEYERLQGYGAGMLADKPKRWRQYLRMMLTDDVAREELSQNARFGVSELTIEKQGWRYAEAWEKAIEIRKAAKPREPETPLHVVPGTNTQAIYAH